MDQPEPQHISRAPPPVAQSELEELELKRVIATSESRRTKWRVIGVVAVVLLVGWFFRWDTHVRHADGSSAIMVNRLTGEIRAVYGQTWVKVEREE